MKRIVRSLEYALTDLTCDSAIEWLIVAHIFPLQRPDRLQSLLRNVLSELLYKWSQTRRQGLQQRVQKGQISSALVLYHDLPFRVQPTGLRVHHLVLATCSHLKNVVVVALSAAVVGVTDNHSRRCSRTRNVLSTLNSSEGTCVHAAPLG